MSSATGLRETAQCVPIASAERHAPEVAEKTATGPQALAGGGGPSSLGDPIGARKWVDPYGKPPEGGGIRRVETRRITLR